MSLLDSGTWQGKMFSNGWVPASGGEYSVMEPATGEELGKSGTGSRIGGAEANIEAFTESQWVTMRTDVAPYPS